MVRITKRTCYRRTWLESKAQLHRAQSRKKDAENYQSQPVFIEFVSFEGLIQNIPDFRRILSPNVNFHVYKERPKIKDQLTDSRDVKVAAVTVEQVADHLRIIFN